MITNSNKKIGILRISLIGACLMALSPLSIDMYLPAFSLIARDLNTTAGAVQLSLSVFFAGLTIGQLFYGPLSDRFGRKGPLLIGLTMYSLGGLGCILTADITVFILCRFIQSLGAAAGMVISQVLVPDIFKDKKSSSLVFSILMLVLGIAPIIAPSLGSLILGIAGWKWIFSTLLFFGVGLIITVIIALPETSGANRSVRISRTFHSYAKVIKHPGFLNTALVRSLANAGMFIYITSAPFIFTQLLHLDETQFGLVFACTALSMMVGNLINSFLLKKYSPELLYKTAIRIVLSFSLLSAISGFIAPTLFLLIIPIMGYLFGLGMIMPNATSLALMGHGANSGSASALIGSFQFAFAFCASGIISFLPKEGALPMTLGVAFCGLCTAGFYCIKNGCTSERTNAAVR